VSAPVTTLDRPLPAEGRQPGATQSASGARSPGRTLALSFVVSLVAAMLCSAVLNTPIWWTELRWWLALLVVVAKPLDFVVLWLVLLLLMCVTNRLWLSIGLLLVTCSVLSAVNVVKLSILGEPVFPSDTAFLTTPGFLVSMVPPSTLALAVAGVVVLMVSVLALGRRIARRYPRITRREHRALWNRLVVVRVILTVAIVVMVAETTRFNEPGNKWREAWDSNNALWLPFSQAMNYRTNGFVGGLLYNMPVEAMPRPAGYSEATMAEVAKRFTRRAAARNAGLTPGAIDDVNVVVVLSESFGDLTTLNGIEVGRDPMPRLRETIAGAWGGETLANFYGSGTSSMEFSALTGQNLGLFNPQVLAPYQNFMTGLDSYPSAVGWFRSRGHRAIAVHPYSTEMYRRKTIYPMLGFEQFLHDSNMERRDRLEKNRFISDQAAFEEVEDLIVSNEDPLLVNLVTMQNHVPTAEWYDDPVPIDGLSSETDLESVGGYARGVEYSDEALERFLADLSASDEETVVVYYGDHWPGIFSDRMLEDNRGLDRLRTPLLIWSSAGQEPRPLPLTSASQYLPYVFDLVGEPLPPYYELLNEVAEEIGALGPGRIVAPDGTELTRADLTEEQEKLLHDYELVQYDFSIGSRYVVDEMWYPFD
jgi:phosphoglycerol transferase MdoB-like AlkP superfamily enzyme